MPQVRRAAVARASPFRCSLYVHPTVLRCRDKRSRKDGTVDSLPSLSLPISLSFPRRAARRYSAYTTRGANRCVCACTLFAAGWLVREFNFRRRYRTSIFSSGRVHLADSSFSSLAADVTRQSHRCLGFACALVSRPFCRMDCQERACYRGNTR